MLRGSFVAVLVLLAAMIGCQPSASSPSSKPSDKTEKQTNKSTESGIKPPNPDPGN